MERAKIEKVTLHEKTTESDVSLEWASIESDGNLRLDGVDCGDTPLKFWGDDDYEYWLIVNKEWKDTILLLLLKERFSDFGAIRKWLDEKHIPNSFGNWI
jgi:hypothetical protein